MTTDEKCRNIVERIRDIVNADPNKIERVSFSCDWGGNGLTLEIGGGHTHVGDPDGSLERLVDDLLASLTGGPGLSFAPNEGGAP